MAVDYLFVGVTFSFVITILFTILGWFYGLSEKYSWGDFGLSVLFMTIAIPASFETGWLLLGSGEEWMEAFFWIFIMLGFINFVFLILLGVQALRIRRYEKRGWDSGYER